MTEGEWLACTDPEPMLEYLGDKASSRKLRLFACGCCRHIWHLLTDPTNRKAVELSKRGIADRMATDQVVIDKADQMLEVAWNWDRQLAAYYAINLNFDSGYCRGGFRAVETSPHDWMGAVACAHEASGNITGGKTPSLDEIVAEETIQCGVLRHIIGNPFHPYAAPASWPSTVVQLAASLYEGHDCRGPLSDALEESGHSELAEHFRAESWHPKGCYAMDLILGKE